MKTDNGNKRIEFLFGSKAKPIGTNNRLAAS
jgi:hypothetical protein